MEGDPTLRTTGEGATTRSPANNRVQQRMHPAVKFIQINLGRDRAATAYINQLQKSEDIDIMLIAEPYTDSSGNIPIRGSKVTSKRDHRGQRWAAIVSNRPDIGIINVSGDDSTSDTQPSHFAAAIIKLMNTRIMVVSVYVPPYKGGDAPADDREHKKRLLAETMQQITELRRKCGNPPVIVGGDLNTRFDTLEDTQATCQRRQEILRNFEEQEDLIMINEICHEKQPTFIQRRPRAGGEMNIGTSIIDLTYVSTNYINRIDNWRVDQALAPSDHAGIRWEMEHEAPQCERPAMARHIDFNGASEILKSIMTEKAGELGLQPWSANEAVSHLTDSLKATLKKLTKASNRLPSPLAKKANQIKYRTRHRQRQKDAATNQSAQPQNPDGDEPLGNSFIQDAVQQVREEIKNIKHAEPLTKRRKKKNINASTQQDTREPQTKHPTRQAKSAPWWDGKLERARKIHERCKRCLAKEIKKCQKNSTRPRDTLDRVRKENADIEAAYKSLIKESKEAAWRRLCSSTGHPNAWSIMYKACFGKLKTKQPQSIIIREGDTKFEEADIIEALLQDFFPTDDENIDTAQQAKKRKLTKQPYTTEAQEEDITVEEIERGINNQGAFKAPGCDGIPAALTKATKEVILPTLHQIFNQCLTTGYFPDDWKKATVVAIPKPNKPANTTKGWRPICLLPTMAKLLDRIMIDRIQRHMILNKQITGRQHGFTGGKSTVHAVEEACRLIEEKRRDHHVAALFLDIAGAFDTCWHVEILSALRQAKIPAQLYKLADSYLSNRKATLKLNNTEKTISPNRGCPQGSASGPGFWNIVYEDFLRQAKGKNEYAHLQAYADDGLVITWAPDTATLKKQLRNLTTDIIKWGKERKLEFGPHKTEMIYFSKNKQTNRAKPRSKKEQYDLPEREKPIYTKMANKPIEFHIPGYTIKSSQSVRYLGVWLDPKLQFESHIDKAVATGKKRWAMLKRIATRQWGISRDSASLIYKGAIEPAITYACPVWASAINSQRRPGELTRQTKALLKLQMGIVKTVNRSFATVAGEAGLVLANITPIDIRINEIATCWRLKNEPGFMTHYGTRTLEYDDIPKRTSEEWPRINTETAERFRNIHRTDADKKTHITIATADSERDPEITTIWATNTATGHTLAHIERPETEADDGVANIICKVLDLNRRANKPLVLRVAHDNGEAIVNGNAESAKAIRRGYWHLLRPAKVILGPIDAADNVPEPEQVPTSQMERPNYKAIVREWTAEWWQKRWSKTTVGRRTRHMLPTITDRRRVHWLKPDRVSTQIVTGHGHVRKYLHTIGKEIDPLCQTCGSTETIEHVIWECSRYDQHRSTLTEISKAIVETGENRTKAALYDKKVYTEMVRFVRETGALDEPGLPNDRDSRRG